MTELPTAVDVARAVADALERHGLPYAIAGALALGFYAAPRATVDVDVNVFISPASDLPRALAALVDAGFIAHDEEPALRNRAVAEGQPRDTCGSSVRQHTM